MDFPSLPSLEIFVIIAVDPSLSFVAICTENLTGSNSFAVVSSSFVSSLLIFSLAYPIDFFSFHEKGPFGSLCVCFCLVTVTIFLMALSSVRYLAQPGYLQLYSKLYPFMSSPSLLDTSYYSRSIYTSLVISCPRFATAVATSLPLRYHLFPDLWYSFDDVILSIRLCSTSSNYIVASAPILSIPRFLFVILMISFVSTYDIIAWAIIGMWSVILYHQPTMQVTVPFCISLDMSISEVLCYFWLGR